MQSFAVKFTVKYGNFLGKVEYFHGWKGLSNGNWDEDYKSMCFNRKKYIYAWMELFVATNLYLDVYV